MGAFLDFFRQGTLRRQAVWHQVAAERGGRYIIPKWYKSSHERIEALVDGVALVLDTYEQKSGDSSVSYSRCVGTSIVGRLPEFRVYKEGAFSSLGKMLGTQDVTLGSDSAFDELFMVKTDDPAGTREAWTASAQIRMRAGLLMAKVESDGLQIKLVERGKYKNAAQLDAAMDLVVELASRDCFGAAALRAVGGPGFIDDKNSYPRVELHDPAPVIIEARDIDGRLATVAMLKEVGDWQPVVAEIRQGALVDKRSFHQFSALAHAQVTALGDATLVVEAAQPPKIQWPGVEHRSERLIAGARILGALAGIGQRRL